MSYTVTETQVMSPNTTRSAFSPSHSSSSSFSSSRMLVTDKKASPVALDVIDTYQDLASKMILLDLPFGMVAANLVWITGTTTGGAYAGLVIGGAAGGGVLSPVTAAVGFGVGSLVGMGIGVIGTQYILRTAYVGAKECYEIRKEVTPEAYKKAQAELQSILGDTYLCPIGGYPMMDPVYIACGKDSEGNPVKHRFERSEILGWLKKADTCPACREKIKISDIRADFEVLCRIKKAVEAECNARLKAGTPTPRLLTALRNDSKRDAEHWYDKAKEYLRKEEDERRIPHKTYYDMMKELGSLITGDFPASSSTSASSSSSSSKSSSSSSSSSSSQPKEEGKEEAKS